LLELVLDDLDLGVLRFDLQRGNVLGALQRELDEAGVETRPRN